MPGIPRLRTLHRWPSFLGGEYISTNSYQELLLLVRRFPSIRLSTFYPTQRVSITNMESEQTAESSRIDRKVKKRIRVLLSYKKPANVSVYNAWLTLLDTRKKLVQLAPKMKGMYDDECLFRTLLGSLPDDYEIIREIYKTLLPDVDLDRAIFRLRDKEEESKSAMQHRLLGKGVARRMSPRGARRDHVDTAQIIRGAASSLESNRVKRNKSRSDSPRRDESEDSIIYTQTSYVVVDDSGREVSV